MPTPQQKKEMIIAGIKMFVDGEDVGIIDSDSFTVNGDPMTEKITASEGGQTPIGFFSQGTEMNINGKILSPTKLNIEKFSSVFELKSGESHSSTSGEQYSAILEADGIPKVLDEHKITLFPIYADRTVTPHVTRGADDENDLAMLFNSAVNTESIELPFSGDSLVGWEFSFTAVLDENNKLCAHFGKGLNPDGTITPPSGI